MTIDLAKYCRHGFRIEGPCASLECNENRELRAENKWLKVVLGEIDYFHRLSTITRKRYEGENGQ